MYTGAQSTLHWFSFIHSTKEDERNANHYHTDYSEYLYSSINNWLMRESLPRETVRNTTNFSEYPGPIDTICILSCDDLPSRWHLGTVLMKCKTLHWIFVPMFYSLNKRQLLEAVWDKQTLSCQLPVHSLLCLRIDQVSVQRTSKRNWQHSYHVTTMHKQNSVG